MGSLGRWWHAKGAQHGTLLGAARSMPTYEKESSNHRVWIKPDTELGTVILTVVGSGSAYDLASWRSLMHTRPSRSRASLSLLVLPGPLLTDVVVAWTLACR